MGNNQANKFCILVDSLCGLLYYINYFLIDKIYQIILKSVIKKACNNHLKHVCRLNSKI